MVSKSYRRKEAIMDTGGAVARVLIFEAVDHGMPGSVSCSDRAHLGREGMT